MFSRLSDLHLLRRQFFNFRLCPVEGIHKTHLPSSTIIYPKQKKVGVFLVFQHVSTHFTMKNRKIGSPPPVKIFCGVAQDDPVSKDAFDLCVMQHSMGFTHLMVTWSRTFSAFNDVKRILFKRPTNKSSKRHPKEFCLDFVFVCFCISFCVSCTVATLCNLTTTTVETRGAVTLGRADGDRGV